MGESLARRRFALLDRANATGQHRFVLLAGQGPDSWQRLEAMLDGLLVEPVHIDPETIVLGLFESLEDGEWLGVYDVIARVSISVEPWRVRTILAGLVRQGRLVSRKVGPYKRFRALRLGG